MQSHGTEGNKREGKRQIMQKLKIGRNRQKKQGQSKLVTRIIAVLFIGSGIVLGNVAKRYGAIKQEEAEAIALAEKQAAEALAAAALTKTREEEEKAGTKLEKEESENLPEPYKAAPDKLNLAYFYPEDAESDEIIDSYAGQVFQELMVMDLDWLADLYELSDISPSVMASRLGKSKKAIMGSYNPRDKAHKAQDSSSWVIHDWKKIHVNFINGDGQSVQGFSNVKDILSMASVYTYSTDMMDVDTFAEYSRQLWKNSHIYSLSMGDLYYCSGCLNKTEEELVREAEEDELAAEKAFSKAGQLSSPVDGDIYNDTEAEMSLSGEETLSATQETESPALKSSQLDSSETLPAMQETESLSASEENSAWTEEMESFTAGGENSAWTKEMESFTAGGENSVWTGETDMSAAQTEMETASSELSQDEEGWDILAAESTDTMGNDSAIETTDAGYPEMASLPEDISENKDGSADYAGTGLSASGSVLGAASPSDLQNLEKNNPDAQGAQITNKKGQKTQYDCPGHVDLYIRVKILGLEDKKGLFSISPNAEKKKWEGWTEENIDYVKKISNQDWFDDYGLSVSSISLSTPLTNQEIDGYMDQLPADTSVTRRNIIHFALSSVGRVPYYWGGKAATPGYEGNNFGALVPADDKGRLLKGLDCSGWVSWVYWSATGKRLAGESTSSLCLCGVQVSRKELKPGDIIVRTGTGAHVVMFLSWNADGRMNVIHETSASINNVTITTMDAPWPYYRKLVE